MLIHKFLILLLSSLLLVGCQTTKDSSAVINPVEKVKLNPRSLEPCAPLRAVKLPENGEDGFLYFLENHTANANMYAECASKQNNSIILLKRFANIKDIPDEKN